MRKAIINRGFLVSVGVAMFAVVALAVVLSAPDVRADPPEAAGDPPVATKISYQGQLRDSSGNLLSGAYDMQFQFWNAAVGGSQAGSAIVKNDVAVTNGLFSVKLDVDESVFNGQALWLEVQVEGEVLGPRQEILPVPYALHSLGPCYRYEVPDAAGQYYIEVPSFAIGGMCVINLWHDGQFGAFDEGFLWDVYYTQSSSDNSWVGGPNVSIGGASFSAGAGVNGDGTADFVYEGGMTIGGGYVRLTDDSVAESSPYQWTIDFQPDPGNGFTKAVYYISPCGRVVDQPVGGTP